jgi:PqqD family protein of HPr-rel-A system
VTQKGRVVWRRIGPAVSKNPEFDPAPVFDPATGETHFLTDLPLLLLETVVESPGTTEDLITALAGPVELDDAEAGRITAALHLLEDAELIESVQQPTD